LGHLVLTIKVVDCVSLSKGNIAFDQPANPPSVPVHKDKATQAEISKENRQHKARHLKFLLWHNVNAMLRNLIVAAVPGIFLAAKKKLVTWFENVTYLELLTQLSSTTRAAKSQKKS
jgi:hypothetical protein